MITSFASWCRFCNGPRHFQTLSLASLPASRGACWFEDLVIKIITDTIHLLPKKAKVHVIPGGVGDVPGGRGKSGDNEEQREKKELLLCTIEAASTKGVDYVVPIEVRVMSANSATSDPNGTFDPVVWGSEKCIFQRLEAASDWVKKCEGTHISCWSERAEVSLPTRVLDLSAVAEMGTVTIVDGQGLRERYVALSYCWGGKSPLRALKSNIHQLREGVSIEKLPKTAQDTVLVCRRLGIRYLWIDSLCIVQDDP